MDIDVGSSKSAASVVGLVQGALKGLVIDMAITMEGHSKVLFVLIAAALLDGKPECACSSQSAQGKQCANLFCNTCQPLVLGNLCCVGAGSVLQVLS